MSAFNKYDTPPPRISDRYAVDNPLLPKEGIPLDYDNFFDSTERIVESTNTSDVRFDSDELWNPSGSGLAGIDITPDNKDKQFDLGKFNKVFERNKLLRKETQRIKEFNKLNELSDTTQTRQSLYDLSLLQIIVNTKNAWFNLLDDLLDQRFELNTLIRDNRIFYIGITILFIAIILYLYVMITQTNNNDKNNSNNNTSYVYHIYQHPDIMSQ